MGYRNKVMSNVVRTYMCGRARIAIKVRDTEDSKKEEGVMMVPVIMVDATLERTRKRGLQ